MPIQQAENLIKNKRIIWATELGSGWHIPDKPEWANLDASGGWSSWSGLYDSDLKLHAVGYLSNLYDALCDHGSRGHYWSSTQGDASNRWRLFFGNGSSTMDSNPKVFGYIARCLRN